jgi:hypothetical protein
LSHGKTCQHQPLTHDLILIRDRHGARLDAADKQWHLTSPTPYDPPLTYGGWTQCRALGARIASLLQAREELAERQGGGNGHAEDVSGHGERVDGDTPHAGHQPHKRRKKHKIVLHSSPFLRCVQTSVAISAGISQWRGQQELAQREEVAKETDSRSSDPAPQETAAVGIPSPGATSASPGQQNARSDTSAAQVKPRLRIDAFLGEWLSPDYYENITSPPGSLMMIAGAKAELLRRGEHIDSSHDPSKIASTMGNFPGGWGSMGKQSAPTKVDPESLVESISNVSLKSVQRERANTVASNGSAGHVLRESSAQKAHPVSNGYEAPIPRYAISPSDPIPAGYVKHAQNACVEVDYQWDSMRPPQDWGDGGEYGEEWSSMHKRFRKGLQSMIAWYRVHRDTSIQPSGHKQVLHVQPDDEDEDTETVLILVSHGAGCNALIGALTNQPVLLDVSMASLTMAVRRNDTERSEPPHTDSTSPSTSPMSAYTRHIDDYPLPSEYSVQLTAATDHLRAASAAQPLTSPILTSDNNLRHHSASVSQPSNILASAPGPRIAPRRNRFDSLTSKTIKAAENALFTPPDSPIRNTFGVQRSASIAVHPINTGVSRSNSGLWSRPSTGASTPQRTWSIGQASATSQQSTDQANGAMTWAPSSSPVPSPSTGRTGATTTALDSVVQGEDTTSQRKEEGERQRVQPTLKSGTNIAGRRPPSPSSIAPVVADPSRELVDSERDIVSPLGAGGLWGGGGGAAKKPGMSAMAMALRGGIGAGAVRTETDDEVTQRERGMKRRWTVNERGEL